MRSIDKGIANVVPGIVGKSLDEIEQDLKDSAARHRSGIIATHDLQETLNKKGVALSMACRIYEVCNPQKAKRVLEADGAISVALPCRISVFGSPEHYTLATMRPTERMKGFASPDVEPVAREVERVILQMMQDAASRRPWCAAADPDPRLQ